MKPIIQRHFFAFAFLLLALQTTELKAQMVTNENYDKLNELYDKYGSKLNISLKIGQSDSFISKLDFSEIKFLKGLYLEFGNKNGFQEKIFTEISKIDSIHKLYITADNYDDISEFIKLCNNSKSLPHVNELSLRFKNSTLIDSFTLFPGTNNFNVKNICDIVNFSSSNNLKTILWENNFENNNPNFIWVDTNVEFIFIYSESILEFKGPTLIRANLTNLSYGNFSYEKQGLSIKLNIDFKNLPNLEELRIDAPHIKNNLKNISTCNKLYNVEINSIDDAWQTLDSLSLCKNLTDIDISGDIKKTGKYKLSNSFKNLNSLWLDMDFLPKQFFKYTPELTNLDFGYNCKKVPNGLKQCKKLTSVTMGPIGHNLSSLKNIPKNITHLITGENDTLDLLKEIKRFTKLKTLQIFLNDLKIVDKKKKRIDLIDALLSKMPSLEKISISFSAPNYRKNYPKYIWPDMNVLIKKYPNVTFEYDKVIYERYYEEHKNYYEQLNQPIPKITCQ